MRHGLIVPVLALVLGFERAAGAHGLDLTSESASLSELKGAMVRVAPLPAGAAGLEPDSIRARLSARLRESGIECWSEANGREMRGRPYLEFEMEMLPIRPSGDLVLRTSLQLRQDGVLRLNGIRFAGLTTWHTASIVYLPKGHPWTRRLWEDLDRELAEFVQAWQEANPR